MRSKLGLSSDSQKNQMQRQSHARAVWQGIAEERNHRTSLERTGASQHQLHLQGAQSVARGAYLNFDYCECRMQHLRRHLLPCLISIARSKTFETRRPVLQPFLLQLVAAQLGVVSSIIRIGRSVERISVESIIAGWFVFFFYPYLHTNYYHPQLGRRTTSPLTANDLYWL